MVDDRLELERMRRRSNPGRELRGEVFAKHEIVRASFVLPPNLLHSSQPNESITLENHKDSLDEDRYGETIYSRVLQLKEEGDVYSYWHQYDRALPCYQKIFSEILGGQHPLAPGFYNEVYLDLLRADQRKSYRFPMFLAMVSCCSSIAAIYRFKQDYMSAIDWIEEAEVLYGCFHLVYPESHPASLKISKTLEYVTYHMEAALQLVMIFSELQNTSSAAFSAYLCNRFYPRRYPPDIRQIRELQHRCNEAVGSYFEHRHPDPNCASTWDVKDPSLQIRGIWSKLTPQSSLRPTRRHHRNTWVWRNRIYIAFGILRRDGKTDCADDGDAWCIDINTMDRWRRLPDIPMNLRRPPAQAEKHVIYGDYAWFFTGRLDVLRFNMIAETWDIVKTHADFDFPYDSLHQYDSYIELYDDKLCVFGGSRDFIMFKKRIFMLLDLGTLIWEDLLGSLTEEEKNKMPSPRYGCIAWVSPKEDRFFLMYGCKANEDPPEIPVKPFPNKLRNYYELWSYSFLDKEWTRERLRGNLPCHRLTPICAYHKEQDKLVLFGGLSEDVPSLSTYAKIGGSRDLPYSTFADTFVLDLKTRVWQQVVTRTFPAWRSTAVFLIDDAGNMFLHGGLSFRDIHLGAPERQLDFYCFTDTWQLHIDFPGSPFDERLFLTTPSNFKAGCWRQCWVCKRIGTGYFVCQGTCEGKYIYCSVDCQRSSWETHRTVHRCRKRIS